MQLIYVTFFKKLWVVTFFKIYVILRKNTQNQIYLDIIEVIY